MRKHEIKAFTIFEITVVLALLSIITTIIFVSLNRFSEQLKISSELNYELNEWFAFRSNFWRELYTADSINLKDNEVIIFSDNRIVCYRERNEILERKTNDQWKPLEIKLESIVSNSIEGGTAIHFNFIWKEEIMKLSFMQLNSVKQMINNHFNELKNE
jgi:competence protein ComGF